ncbi:Vi polysaccharide biosynthesis UDP-N-acetylglucosamine C-6 dehydrogenase TviB [Ramlibacter sp. USB13]|uniref:Vi polysaccharide biosynthesis UDP-N-acetylglucosamine C-6 dehydrogenase TviB n=1 Tax=Ramlibacter cellulosilyticus TaxID=2764187 RepID=A0A923SD19_9BURK|nr:Vi polysaccharide biosynthesis UDP-N-acetylglucosamine C-6 dehydrogenase TviB [Ramlibacter cellulosilyticus]MBC5784873.1 Vi polysaccharide biosynthesis UDP-N-acetylglucosamine C-6 dehydrogenase TviB [Ramlibacter cellulosilyticus]
MQLQDKTLAVIGLGYVGLPLAVEFGRRRRVIGFDINPNRVAELRGGSDHTLECSRSELQAASQLRYSSDPADLKAAQVFIVTVPTPVDQANRPDMTPLVRASETVGKALKTGDLVIYESTVYPGATEEVCVPVLERVSGLKFNKDFYCGYSPERINPGDKEHRLPSIRKVTSGSTPEVADAVDALYAQIITAGTHKASSIKVAEAAKVIENTQRDVNIALMNELSLIFHRLGVDTLEVLQAAGTKWNFLPFRPGLVGGHCIGVDPYYLTHKAQEVGYHPEVILAGRRINDNMARHVADETVKLMLRKEIPVLASKVLVLGLSFKENCPDVRNTKVVDIVRTLERYNTQVDVYDPWVNVVDAEHEYGLKCLNTLPTPGTYAAIVVAVGHRQFVELGESGVRALGQPGAVVYDVKGVLPPGAADGRL